MSGRVYRVVQFGLGPIGQELVRLVLERRSCELVGVIDIDPTLVGRDAGELIGLGQPVGVVVREDAEAVLAETRPDCVLHATGSYLDRVFPQLELAVRLGCNVVSTCEELAFPTAGHPELAARLDALAREHGVTVLGTGVNPGYVMDTLPLFLSGVAQAVTAVRVERIQNASTRRRPLQEKIGSGKTVEEFQELVAAGTVRHVGLRESAYLLAAGLGWTIEHYEERIEPVLAERRIVTQYFTVEPGRVCGVDQLGRGFVAGEERITLHLRMYLDADPAYDRVRLEGPTPLELVIPGGLQGDRATTAIALNAVPRVVEHAPGLVTMADLPLITARD
ncbi:hypothetical protein NET03_05205 [Thermomicrobium sp. CFH 73360]|uniref:NAD(P)H-dependent amine dehydrogenase family protein n=1 Tax=Thermomicrobium sp. CFH 73360 TaxID=2951987 RepID=UPI002076FAFF|nr:hypothetical protein [Thermomicrobium sp. CFH 73360]